ncbi:MAG: group 1 glycosyl transferase [Anaerospora sp.]|jgi:galacturonosyltransferase|nr:group 1 glycosyl transferase [Anaerospora sp.]
MQKVLILANHEFTLYNFRKEVIEKILENNYDVYLCLPYGEKIEYFKKKGCKYIDVNIDRRGVNPFIDFKLILFYIRTIRRINPEIVLTYTSKTSIYGGIACSLLQVPFLVNNSGLIVLPEKFNLLKPFISLLYIIGITKSNCMFYQNIEEQKTLNKILNRQDKYRLIPGSGVNLQDHKFCEFLSDNNGVVFNYVARIMKGKGIEEYLICAKKIKEKYPNCTFNILGFFDDDYYKTIIEAYQKSGIINYLGEKKDIRPFIEKSHAIIHTSYSEGMSNVMLEHCAMGRPCIASNIPGCREIVDEGKTGYLFELKNVDQLVEKVEKFIKLSGYEKKLMGKNAREKVEREFDRDIIVKAYIEEIEKVCSNF